MNGIAEDQVDTGETTFETKDALSGRYEHVEEAGTSCNRVTTLTAESLDVLFRQRQNKTCLQASLSGGTGPWSITMYKPMCELACQYTMQDSPTA